MHIALIFVLTLVGHVCSQDNLNETVKDLIKDIFSSSSTSTQPTPTTTTCPPNTFCPPGFNVIPSSTTESSLSYIEKCGEGKTKGKRKCINYEFCDPRTDTIVTTRTRIRSRIDIGRNVARCGDMFERCCLIPEGGLPPDFDPNNTPTTTSSPGTTSPPKPSFSSSRCGIRNENGVDFQIKENNNTLAEFGEFPWMVALMKKKPDSSSDKRFSICGGSLISPRAVLTAAHCVFDYRSTPAELKIRVGEWNSKRTNQNYPYQERNVASIILSTNYNRKTILNDVALLVLESPVVKDDHIGAICLPNQDQVIESRNCFSSGWGETVEEAEVYLDILKKIDLPMVPSAQCQKTLRGTALGQYFRLHDSLVCAGGVEGKDACTGDGGSPLVCPDPNNSGRYILTGLVAAGLGCGEQDVPGVYVKVSKFRSWIDEQMKSLNLDTNTYIS